MLQRRGGLDISEARAAFDALEARGETVDRKGDGLANGGEYNRRHNAVVRAIYDMVAAVAVGPVILGDKEDPSKTDMINVGHVIDVAEIGGDDEGGGDVGLEVKAPSPLAASYQAGNGSKEQGGSTPPCSLLKGATGRALGVGHLFRAWILP